MFGRSESKDVDCEFRLVQDVSRQRTSICSFVDVSLSQFFR